MRRLLAVALVASGGALAHPPPEKIEVEGHYSQSLGTTDAASQGTVTAKLIETRPTLRPAEVLEFVPGVIVTQHSGGGKANQYFLRGFNLDHGTDFATFVAGMPVNMPTHAHGQGYTDLNFLIPELVSRIDYFKGPYFASLGDFASAGAARIDLVTELAQDSVSMSIGQRGYRRFLAAGSTGALGGTLLGALELSANDGPWRTPEDLRRVNGVLRYSRGDREGGWSVTAMSYTARWNATDQVPLRAVEGGVVDRFGAIDPSDAGRTQRQSLSAEARTPWAGGDFSASAYAIRSRLNLFSNFTYVLDDERGDQFEQAERRTAVGGAAAWRRAHGWGNAELTHTLGVQLRQDKLSPVGLYRTIERGRLGTTREDRVTERSAGVYYENATHWTPMLRTLLGLRHDRSRFEVASDDPVNGGRLGAGITSPKASLVVGPVGQAEAFFNWGRGFHSNDARGTTIAIDPATREPATRVTPLARTTGHEIGVRVSPVAGLQSSLSLWELRLASELVFAGDAGTTEASRPSRRRGVEWNNHWVVNPHLLLDLDVAISRARFRDDDPAGDRVPGAVGRVVSAGVTLVDIGPWSGSVQLRHFGPRDLVEDGRVRSRATTLAYARLGYELSRRWSVSLDAFNLLDRKASDIDYLYASRLRGEPAGGIEDVHFHPVEPRTFRLTLTARF